MKIITGMHRSGTSMTSNFLMEILGQADSQKEYVESLALLLPSIQGLGISENVYEYLLSQAGAPQALGVTLGLLLFAVKIVTGLIGGIVYFGYTIAKNKESSHHIKSNPA